MPRLPSIEKFRAYFTQLSGHWIQFKAHLNAFGSEEDYFKDILLCSCEGAAISALTSVLSEKANSTYEKLKET